MLRDFPTITHNSQVFEVGASWSLSGKKAWHHLYNHPKVGLKAMTFRLGNPDIFGNAYALIPSITWDIRKRKNFRLQWTMGGSLSYIDKAFDRVDNPENIVMGAHLNYLFQIGIQGVWRTHKPVQLLAGIDLSHFSNGHTSHPNIGINIPALSVGIAYQPPKEQTFSPESPPKMSQHKRGIYPGIKLGYGFAKLQSKDGPLYSAYTATAFLNKDIKHKFNLKAGTEWFFLSSIHDFLQNQNEPEPTNRAWAATGGILYLGFEAMMGRMSLIANVGPYIKRPAIMEYTLYTKMGFQVYLFDQQVRRKNQAFIGVYVHAHSGQADFVETGIGYLF